MTWQLSFNADINNYFKNGADNQLRWDLQTELRNAITGDPAKKGLQVGVPSSADKKLGDNWISIDLNDTRPCIDIKMDLSDMWVFEDEKFDFTICNAVLEHTKNPFECVNEMYRVTKAGGEIWCEMPFVQGYHATDEYGDYWRFTPQGVVELMKPFTMKKIMLADDGGIAYWGSK